MLLIGSRALNHYIKLDRVMHDWDILMDESEFKAFDYDYRKYLVKSTASSHIYDYDGEILEVKEPSQFDPSDFELYEYGRSSRIVDLPFIKQACQIPLLHYLYGVKKATAEFILEPKHKDDLVRIENMFGAIRGFKDSNPFYEQRRAETKARVEKSKKIEHDFFHKYHIPEYIKHDRLHDLYADLLDIPIPTYKRITVAETDITEELFVNLTHEQKISLMVEEVLVLNLERWFIPQMVENGINHRLEEMFYNNNEAMPTYKILKHVCNTGLKGEAEYIVNFGRFNFFEIEKEWQKAKEVIKSKGGFPSWFYNELFDLRNKYKAGIEIKI